MFVHQSLLHFAVLGCPPSGFGERNPDSDTRLLLWNLGRKESVGQRGYLEDSPLFFYLARYRMIGNKGWVGDGSSPPSHVLLDRYDNLPTCMVYGLPSWKAHRQG